jgi:hypothetical protein
MGEGVGVLVGCGVGVGVGVGIACPGEQDRRKSVRGITNKKIREWKWLIECVKPQRFKRFFLNGLSALYTCPGGQCQGYPLRGLWLEGFLLTLFATPHEFEKRVLIGLLLADRVLQFSQSFDLNRHFIAIL